MVNTLSDSEPKQLLRTISTHHLQRTPGRLQPDNVGRSVRPLLLLLLISDQSSLMTSWSLSEPPLSLLSFQHSLHDQHAGLRHPDAAAVPSAGEEPGHSRLPAQQATLLLGVAQLPPVSLMHLATAGAPCGHSTSSLALSRVHMCGRVQGTECFL